MHGAMGELRHRGKSQTSEMGDLRVGRDRGARAGNLPSFQGWEAPIVATGRELGGSNEECGKCTRCERESESLG